MVRCPTISLAKPDLKWSIVGGQWSTLAEQRKAAHELLEQLVGEAVTVEHDDKGAPWLPERPELSVSISHCRAAVAVAVSSKGRVGIDVESRRRIGDGLMERVCTAEELVMVRAAADPVMAFLQSWTRKEAVLKMRGTGIQGFGSMVDALSAKAFTIQDLETRLPDIVASMATDG